MGPGRTVVIKGEVNAKAKGSVLLPQDLGLWEELLRFPERRDPVQGPAKELSAVRTELFWPGR